MKIMKSIHTDRVVLVFDDFVDLYSHERKIICIEISPPIGEGKNFGIITKYCLKYFKQIYPLLEEKDEKAISNIS